MAYAVVRVDTESDAGDDSCRHIHRGDRGQARHILGGRAKTCFIASQENVGAPIDENDRIQIQASHQMAIAFSNWRNSQLLEGIDRDRLALAGKKLSQ